MKIDFFIYRASLEKSIAKSLGFKGQAYISDAENVRSALELLFKSNELDPEISMGFVKQIEWDGNASVSMEGSGPKFEAACTRRRCVD
jgi:hypothetical protein